jgi:hypothetical protein
VRGNHSTNTAPWEDAMTTQHETPTTTQADTGYPAATTTTMSRSVPTTHVRRTRRLSTETKSAWKTTEFFAYILSVVAVAIASQTIGRDSSAANGDYFRADKAFLYITLLTLGYMLSRGIAKSGSRDYYDEDDDR